MNNVETKYARPMVQKMLLSPGSSISIFNVIQGSIFRNEGHADLILSRGALPDPPKQGMMIRTGFTVNLPEGTTVITVANPSVNTNGLFSIVQAI